MALYGKLKENGFDLEMLQKHLKEEEVDALCTELEFSVMQKVQFRKLMQVIDVIEFDANTTSNMKQSELEQEGNNAAASTGEDNHGGHGDTDEDDDGDELYRNPNSSGTTKAPTTPKHVYTH